MQALPIMRVKNAKKNQIWARHMSKTPFMPLWNGDLLADTLDLDASEVGAYILLIIAQWQRKGASLPDDEKRLQRIARCGRNWPKVWARISVFFERDSDGVFSEKGREVYKNVAAKTIVNSQNGERGGRAKSLKNKDRPLANASETLWRKASIPEPEPDIIKREVNLSRQTDDFAECVLHFNKAAERVGWPTVQKMTKARRAALSQRIADCGGAAQWMGAVDRAARSPFLTGQSSKEWRADFDWLCKAANFTKLMEGNYDQRNDNANGRPLAQRPVNGTDPAIDQISRLTRLGQAQSDDRGGIGGLGQEDGSVWVGARPQ